MTLAFRFKSKEDNWYELVNEICPVCGHKGYCMINEKQDKIVCTRVDTYNGQKGKAFGKNGQHIFFLDNKRTDYKVTKHKDVKHNEMRNNVPLNYVYRCVLEHAFINGKRLNDDSTKDLRKRGLSLDTIERKAFASLQNINLTMFTREVNGKLVWDKDHFRTNYKDWFKQNLLTEDVWKGVPGFYSWRHKEYKDASHNEIIEKSDIIFAANQYSNEVIGFDCIPKQKGCPGFSSNGDYVIPAVDIDNNIFGMQVRHLDKDAPAKYTWVSSKNNEEGTDTNTGVNVALIPDFDKKRDTQEIKNWLHQSRKTVILTEGILKSIVAAEHLPKVFSKKELSVYGSVVLGNAGVSQWKKFMPVLKGLHASNVIVAYDMDYKGKDEVDRSRNALINALKKEGYNVAIAEWSKEYKGIDDLLQAGKKFTLKSANVYQQNAVI